MTHNPDLDAMPEKRRKAVITATEGCWPGTQEIVAALVRESAKQPGWRSVRSAAIIAQNSVGGVSMHPEEFFVWRKQAKAMMRVMKRTEHPRDTLGLTPSRYHLLGIRKRMEQRNMLIDKTVALACAHYLMGYELPFTRETVGDWFKEHFGQMTQAARALEMLPVELSARLAGYKIVDGVRKDIEIENHVMMALDWLWRNGPVSPYGDRTVSMFPGQPPMPRSNFKPVG